MIEAPGSGPAPTPPAPGGSRELLALAAPLIVSQSFMTVQVFLDTILLAWHDQREMAASFPAPRFSLRSRKPASPPRSRTTRATMSATPRSTAR